MTSGQLQQIGDGKSYGPLRPVYNPTATNGQQNLSLYTKNNIYIPEVKSDLTLFAYYGVMEYTITINIAEVLTGYFYDEYNDENSGSDPYICYSDEYIENNKKANGGKFVNPTSTINDLLIPVAKDDTYIYTVYDENGIAIMSGEKYVATKITSKMINKKTNNLDCLRFYNNYRVYVTAGPEDERTTVDYIEASGEGRATIAPYKEYKANKTLSNPYNLLNFSKPESESESESELETNLTLKSDLFKITIKDINKPTTYYSKNANTENAPGLKMTYENNMLSFTYKVFADGAYGFPTVTIDANNKDILPGLKYFTLSTTLNLSDTKLLKNSSTQSLQGFYNNLRLNYDSDSENKEDNALTTLDFEVDLLYQYLAYELDATIEYDYDKDSPYRDILKQSPYYQDKIILTGKGQTKPKNDTPDNRAKMLAVQYKISRTKDKTELIALDDDNVTTYQDINSFQIIVIKNAKLYIDMLTAIFKECNNSEVALKAAEYLSSLNEPKLTPKQLETGYILGSGNDFPEQYKINKWYEFINENYKKTETGQKNPINLGEDKYAMRFEIIDILSLYTSKVSYRLYQNCYNTDDSIVYYIKMNTDIIQEQYNETTIQILLAKILWWADQGYYYMNNAKIEFTSKYDDVINNGNSDNNDIDPNYFTELEKQDNNELTGTKKMLRNLQVAFGFKDDKYEGLWKSVMYGYITPTELTGFTELEKVGVKITINKDLKNRIRTKQLDYDKVPTGKWLATFAREYLSPKFTFNFTKQMWDVFTGEGWNWIPVDVNY